MRPWLILFEAIGLSIAVAFGLGFLGWLVGIVFGPTTSQAYVVLYIVSLFFVVLAIVWTWEHRRDIPRFLRARWHRGKMIRSEFER